jgi:hypothetical protein
MIIDLQRRIAEVGRIRIGQQVPISANSRKTRPAKLTTFRLTSPDRTRIQQAAMLYGGELAEWEAPAGKQWEVITESDALNVIVPPGDMAFSQWYEMWAAGGCQRRCDGQYDSVGDQSCVCDPEKRECAIHTRLSVMIRDLPGLGLWRVDTQGYYAALELQGAVEVVQMAAGTGRMLPAKLRLEQRMIKRANQGVKRFAVPVLDIEVSPAQLLGGQAPMIGDGTAGTIAVEPPRRAIEDGGSPLTPVPESVPEAPARPVAEQAAAVKERKPRKGAAQPVPRTGLAPRTAAQAAGRASEPPPPPPPDEPPPPDDEPHRPAQQQQDDSGPDVPASTAQNRMMHALFAKAGMKKEDREDRLAVSSAILGFHIDSSGGLTVAEASKIIDTLQNWLDGHDGAGNPADIENTIREILNAATLAAESSAPTEEKE